MRPEFTGWTASIRRWVDTQTDGVPDGDPDRIDWTRALPFALLHAGCLGTLWTGVSPVALAVAAVLYAVRMFALTGFYHRYFSHRTFRTSRGAQLVFAVLGASCVQRGPLWWAAHHRHHHRHADDEQDLHSPARHGFWWGHMGWFLTPRAFATDMARVPDLRRYPELRWLDRFDAVVPVALALLCYALGAALEHLSPGLGTSGPQMLVWGFFISTVALFHATVTINSLAHRYGKRRYDTSDDSRNNAWLALLTFGESWHNNHHFYPGSARQGFRAREIDITWYGLRLLAATGLIWDLKPVPAWVLTRAKE
ncbi:acyl-CoA desaturase [Achromobacter sp. UMC46]|uniref:acyl-CoA desaturase n=1 Tax=Achromobacter sp. UMC46 TaxID=1862319 RepID=UPI001C81EE66|nr:acyl-CoA desaturase [Achromobacter sp. UMC46]MBB1595826.1 stearoyl-CoA 9-desaturase [Achromobacter sp. UMC46]